MKNEFSDKTKDLFFWNKNCWWCNHSHADCFHHILGRISESPLNVAPLNNMICHIGNGKLNTEEARTMLLQKTLNYLLSNDYKLTENDLKFIQKYKKYYL